MKPTLFLKKHNNAEANQKPPAHLIFTVNREFLPVTFFQTGLPNKASLQFELFVGEGEPHDAGKEDWVKWKEGNVVLELTKMTPCVVINAPGIYRIILPKDQKNLVIGQY